MINCDLAIEERDRYFGDTGEPSEAVAGLRRAAEELHQLADSAALYDRAQMDMWNCASDVAGYDCGSSSATDLNGSWQTQLRAREGLTQALEAHGATFPILKTFDWGTAEDPGQAYALASTLANADDAELEALLGDQVQEIIDNIYQCSANIQHDDLKIWDLPDIVGLTEIDLGINDNPMLRGMLTSYFERQGGSTVLVDLFVAACAITAGIIATAATGGTALAAVAIATAASGVQAMRSAERYIIESAASNVAMDEELRDLSRNDPDLIWLLVDLLALGLDVGEWRAFFGPRAKVLGRLRWPKMPATSAGS
jgi:hypothetical protein